MAHTLGIYRHHTDAAVLPVLENSDERPSAREVVSGGTNLLSRRFRKLLDPGLQQGELDVAESAHGTLFLLPTQNSIEDLSEPVCRTLGKAVRNPGVNLIMAPRLNTILPETFVIASLFENGIAIDDFIEAADQGDDHDKDETAELNGKQTFILPHDRRIFGHHIGPRFKQRAACLQFCDHLGKGDLEYFREDAGVHMNMWCNKRPDEDIAMTYALGLYYSTLLRDHSGDVSRIRTIFKDRSRLYQLVRAESLQDVYAGGANLPDEMRRVLKYVFAPMADVKRKFPNITAEEVKAAFDVVTQRVIEYANGEQNELPLQEDYSAQTMNGWTLVTSAQPDARLKIRKDMPHKFCVFIGGKSTNESRQLVSITNWEEHSPVRMEEFFVMLNTAERLRYFFPDMPVTQIMRELSAPSVALPLATPDEKFTQPWGGNEAGGSYPDGSRFSTEELSDLIGHVMPIAALQKGDATIV